MIWLKELSVVLEHRDWESKRREKGRNCEIPCEEKPHVVFFIQTFEDCISTQLSTLSFLSLTLQLLPSWGLLKHFSMLNNRAWKRRPRSSTGGSRACCWAERRTGGSSRISLAFEIIKNIILRCQHVVVVLHICLFVLSLIYLINLNKILLEHPVSFNLINF